MCDKCYTQNNTRFFTEFQQLKNNKKLIYLVFFVASIILFRVKYILEKRYKKEIE